MLKKKLIPILIGLLLVATAAFLEWTNNPLFLSWITSLENVEMDYQTKNMHKPLGKDTPITIVDIDDKSLAAIGRWPWPREKTAQLVSNLYKQGALVIGFDITFPDPEPQGDLILAESLKGGDSILGIVFKNEPEKAGAVPTPLFHLTPEQTKDLDIQDKKGYLANVDVLQNAAKAEAFINASPDPDGELRYTPLLYRMGDAVYGSLSLLASTKYLLADKIELVTNKYGGKEALEGIKLDQQFIPTEPDGRIVIPYRGPPYSFPYVSAVDIIEGKATLPGKLVIIGSTASALGDVRATPLASAFPGVEVHASVASGIIDRYLPSEPAWGVGVTLLLIAILGLLCALLFPFWGVIKMTITTIVLPALLIAGSQWLWKTDTVFFPIMLPILLIVLLYLTNMIWGFLIESRKSKELKSMFGQYVPPAYLDQMMKKETEFNLEGESKEMSVLFSDIRDFTSVSEKMSAKELKEFMNVYLTPITEVIFTHQGTIDKYVGDMVMAFWNAPLTDPKHVEHAVETGLAMQKKLQELNVQFGKENKPQIRIGVGVNTGIMNVGDMGSKFRKSYTVLGDAVNLASRLEGQTKFYHVGVIVGEGSYNATKDQFLYFKIDKIKVKGKDKAVEIFAPICMASEATPALKAVKEAHESALRSYFNCQWDAAERGFKSLIEKDPERKLLYEVYLERIVTLRKNPPESNWDGAYTSHEK